MGNKGAKNNLTYTELTSNELAALQASTNLTEKDIREWHAGFFHDCPNGTLNKQKFIQIFTQFYVDDHRAEYFCNYVFKMLDKNQDDVIDFEEFLFAISSSSQSELQERLELAFDMYNVTDDGNMDEEELINLMSALYHLVGDINRKSNHNLRKRAKEIIQKFDQDNDKKLSKTEFITACNEDKYLMDMLAPNQKQDA
ncbi:unnamed protein product [Adineta ricciae]|uniref:EF-hand domain-containing protein n=1 Tax=Adineta ricciae TaxID=249248 RepID=A0A814NRS2_ADIRI|nr:unnamed protein product [Adineta ricciae]